MPVLVHARAWLEMAQARGLLSAMCVTLDASRIACSRQQRLPAAKSSRFTYMSALLQPCENCSVPPDGLMIATTTTLTRNDLFLGFSKAS